MTVPTAVTISVAGYDGSTIAWSREDRDDVIGPGRFAGTTEVVNQAVAILAARTQVLLPTGVYWQFPPAPRLRAVDVAAAMIAALQVDGDFTEVLADYPALAAPRSRRTQSAVLEVH